MLAVSYGMLLPFLLAPALHPADGLTACLRGDAEQALTLSQLWQDGRSVEPGYAAAEQAILAERAGRSAVLLEWAPSVSLEGSGNWGQRLSPGEERVLGVGPRSELRMLGAWTFLDSSRRWRAAAADHREAEAALARDAFDITFRSETARLYVEAAYAEALWETRRMQHEALETLIGPVRQRLAAGVEVVWEEHLLDDATARSERRLAEAAEARATARALLSALVGRCVRADLVTPVPQDQEHWLSAGAGARAGEHVEVQRLLRLADAREADAQQEASRDRWRLQLVASAGPTRSRAFDQGPTDNEYLVGMVASWRPDLAGVQRRLGAAEEARARAIRAEAESHRLAVERDLQRTAVQLAHAFERDQGLQQELVQTERRLAVSLLRWQEGVDRWTEVIQAQERVEEVRLLQLDLSRETALALIRHGEASGNLDLLPTQLGQPENDR